MGELASVILGLGCFFSVVAIIIAWRRGFYSQYTLWMAPSQYSVACVVFMQLYRPGTFFHPLFVAFSVVALIAGLMHVALWLRTREFVPNTAFGLSVVVGAICGFSIGYVPGWFSLVLAIATIASGAWAFALWLRNLPYELVPSK